MKKYIIILSIAIVLAGFGLISIISSKSESLAVEPIGVQTAKDIAIKDAGAEYDSLTEIEAELDTKNDRNYYDIDFKVNGKKYSYDIDAMTGAIIESTKNPVVSETVNEEPALPSTDSGLISEQEAKTTVLSRIPGADASNIAEFRLETDDGRYEYEGKVILGEMEYEFELDAYSGSFREWDAESLYDD